MAVGWGFCGLFGGLWVLGVVLEGRFGGAVAGCGDGWLSFCGLWVLYVVVVAVVFVAGGDGGSGGGWLWRWMVRFLWLVWVCWLRGREREREMNK